MTDHHIRQLKTRETRAGFNRTFHRINNVSSWCVNNLELEHTLVGHEGCVNCLDWNYAGTLLASGSDDTKVIIWDFHGYKILKKLNTMHRGNIFSVKFMPKQSNILVTGAADGQIFVHDVHDTAPLGSASVGGRVKRIVTDAIEPQIFISASEDGSINQYDIRSELHADRKTLLILTDANNIHLECKCVAISPTNANHLAVGCNDPVIRLYDRRKLDGPCVTFFTPGHISRARSRREYVTTYLDFNASGNELLANIGNEQIYLFDINEKSKPYVLPVMDSKDASHDSTTATSTAQSRVTPCHKNPKHYSESFHLQGNEFYDKKKYSAAISMYNKALLQNLNPLLLSNRAATYIKRKWVGDHYAALKDCCSALSINPNMVKAHYRLARCLVSLEHADEAKLYIEQFKKIHPEHSFSPSFVSLQDSIEEALNESSRSASSKSSKECHMRRNAFDYKYRYLGHCNTTTDIKEATFFGENGQFIVAGSDEGSFYVWERESTNLVRVMQADSSVVNCLQPHPLLGLLATSGLDNEIKLWSPNLSEKQSRYVVGETDTLMEKNQRILSSNPFDNLFGPLGIRVTDGGESEGNAIGCRQF